MLNKGTCPVSASDKWGFNAPWCLFSKSQWKKGGGLCGGGVCWPAPPPCLFLASNCSAATVSILRNVMVWPPSQGFESAHVRTKKVFRFVYTRLIWTDLFDHVFVCIYLNIFVCSWFVAYVYEHICLLMFCLQMFEHICLLMICVCSCFVSICLNIFVCSWFVFAHVLSAYVWTYLFAHDLCLLINSKG